MRDAYRAAGVDVAAGDRAVELMREAVASTRRGDLGVGPAELGGFGGAFAIPPGYRRPLLIGSTDGVGTKTAIAVALRRFDTIGLDLVAMCADDVVCSGAEPIAFLDYVAVGRLDPLGVAELVGSVAAGCRAAGCTLIGGETAEHPGLLDDEAFDLAGSCIGVVDEDALIDGREVRAGDAVIGLRSSGLHANGFSLVRSLLAQWDIDLGRPYQEQLRLTLGDTARDDALAVEPGHELATLGEVLLTPTRIYARAILSVRDRLRAAGHDLRGVAHITGGGLPGNAPRAVPDALAVRIDPTRWPMPSVMRLFGALGGIEGDELRATFNGGIGMTLVVAAEAVEPALEALAAEGVDALLVGEVAEAASIGGRYAEGQLEGFA